MEKITVIQQSEKDREALQKVRMSPSDKNNGDVDYSKVVIKKPWGYEYLVFNNNHVAIWALHIKERAQTSLHCHPKKKTSLMVLQGEVCVSTLTDDFVMHAGEGLLIDKGTFHGTQAYLPGGAIVMETETPTDKNDLVRLNDNYGREGQGYEGNECHTVLDHKQHTNFHIYQERYHTPKTIGICRINILRCDGKKETLATYFTALDNGIVGILKGDILDQKGVIRYACGDLATVTAIRTAQELQGTSELELLHVQV